MIKIIVAMDPNRLIGKNNQLPWNIKEDLAHFKETTLNHAIVMGRKTYESIGKALPNRINYVLTRDLSFKPKEESTLVIKEIKSLVDKYKNSDQTLYVIGGEQVYSLFLPYTDELVVSQILNFYYGDTYFPDFLNMFESYKVIPKKGFNVVYYRRIK